MIEYAVLIQPSARKELERLEDSIIARLVPRIENLGSEPRPRGCRKLRGFRDLWRLRVGDYRVVYIVDDNARVVQVTRIAHRREVYE